MQLLKQSTAVDVHVLMVDSADHLTGKTGLTLTITACKAGASALTSITPTVTEIGSGLYSLALTTTHTNTLGVITLHITATGADPTDERFQVVLELPGASNAAIADAVWDEALAGHATAGSAGKQLADIATGTAPTAAAIADAVWDELTAGHAVSGSFSELILLIAGYLDTEIAAIKAKTDNLPAAPAAVSNIPTVVQIVTGLLEAVLDDYEDVAATRTVVAALSLLLNKTAPSGGFLVTYLADGSTAWFKRAITPDAGLAAISEVGGAVAP